MNNKAPKISVGMPVYNGEIYLDDAISSVLCQTMTDFELIISDNASTDGTQDICRNFAKQDDRILYTRNEENLGAASNYNRVFKLARGRYFRWANADDLVDATLHEKCIEVLDNNPQAVLTYGRTKLIDEGGKTIRNYDDNLDLQQDLASDRFLRFFQNVGLTNVIYGLMRSDAMRNTNLFGDGSMPSVDVRFMAELTLQGKFVEIPEVLFYRRMHPCASSSYRSDDEWQHNFWKAKAQQFVLPELRLNFGYLRFVYKSQVSGAEKGRLTYYIAKRFFHAKSKIAKELVDYFMSKFRRDSSVNKNSG